MNSTPNIHAIILAAGLSRRMGQENKLLLPYQNRTILTEVISQLSNTAINGITLVTGHERLAVEAAAAAFNLRLCFNPNYPQGQSSSIQAGVKQLPREADGFLICLGDMPKITSAHYQSLISEFSNLLSQNKEVILRPMKAGQQPGHPVCFAKKYQAPILAAAEEDGCRSVILKNRSHLVEWETEEAVYFLDVDTRGEYEAEQNS